MSRPKIEIRMNRGDLQATTYDGTVILYDITKVDLSKECLKDLEEGKTIELSACCFVDVDKTITELIRNLNYKVGAQEDYGRIMFDYFLKLKEGENIKENKIHFSDGIEGVLGGAEEAKSLARIVSLLVDERKKVCKDE